ncbi:MAG: RDD family protein [Bacilli bacterium]|nr:RDD family protein [Bacilli bacterium]
MVKAPLLRRLVAWIIDAIIIGIVVVIVLLCTSLTAIFNLIKEGTSLTLTLYSLIELVQVGLVIEILFILYYISIPVRNNGQTFGKKMLKIRIVKDNGDDVNFSTLFMRQTIASQLISALTFGATYIVSALLALFRKDKKSIGDIFANTKVVFIEEEE